MMQKKAIQQIQLRQPKVFPVQSFSPVTENGHSFSNSVSVKDSNSNLNNMSEVSKSDDEKLFDIDLECENSVKTNLNEEGIESTVIHSTNKVGEMTMNDSGSNIVDVIMEELEIDNNIITLDKKNSLKSIIDFGGSL